MNPVNSLSPKKDLHLPESSRYAMHLKPSHCTIRSRRGCGAGGGVRGGVGKAFLSINAHYHIKLKLPNFNCGCLLPCGVRVLLECCRVNLRTEGPTGLMSSRPPESGVAAPVSVTLRRGKALPPHSKTLARRRGGFLRDRRFQ
jgi:hypothetical protein